MYAVFFPFITGVVTFCATNIDDIFVLMLFFSQERVSGRHIVIGQYLGFTAIILISLIGFAAGLLIPQQWISLLGVFPIAIGIRQWLNRGDSQDMGSSSADSDSTSSSWSTVWSVAAITFANGGDNIGIYTPLFARSDWTSLLSLLSVFYVLLGVLCYVGYFLTRHPLVARIMTRYSQYIVPFVLISLGTYILLEQSFRELFGH